MALGLSILVEDCDGAAEKIGSNSFVGIFLIDNDIGDQSTISNRVILKHKPPCYILMPFVPLVLSRQKQGKEYVQVTNIWIIPPLCGEGLMPVFQRFNFCEDKKKKNELKKCHHSTPQLLPSLVPNIVVINFW